MIQTGQLLTEGKTKKIFALADDPHHVIVASKDDITAGDGAKHDVMAGKAQYATATTCNVFRFLRKCGIPVAFEERLGETTFVAKRCEMIPLEVVVRREAHGSFLKRYPYLQKGSYFPRLVFELFLKTTGRRFGELQFPCDDPLLLQGEGNPRFRAVDPKAFGSSWSEELDAQSIGLGVRHLGAIEFEARRIFLLLEKAWQLQGRRLVDFKLEFGITTGGELVLSDVVDNDSWRVLEDGRHLDKQGYRDGDPLAEVSSRYRDVAELTGRFYIPRQQVILWTASVDDAHAAFEAAFVPFSWGARMSRAVCSLHKEPERGLREVRELVQKVPDSVLIVVVGRSNGAGPTLSAHTHVPVITIPANYREFPDDVWSSLRTPSATPCMTVLEPGNAVLAAVQILAITNPALYAQLRGDQERRFVNSVPLS